MDEMTTHEPLADEDSPATASQEHAPAGDTPNGGPAPEALQARLQPRTARRPSTGEFGPRQRRPGCQGLQLGPRDIP